MKSYYDLIKEGIISAPQYEGRESEDQDEWLEQVKTNRGRVLVDKDNKKIKIKKLDDKGNSIEGVNFTIYGSKEDAEKGFFNIFSHGFEKNDDAEEDVKIYFYDKDGNFVDNFEVGIDIIDQELFYERESNGLYGGEYNLKFVRQKDIDEQKEEKDPLKAYTEDGKELKIKKYMAFGNNDIFELCEINSNDSCDENSKVYKFRNNGFDIHDENKRGFIANIQTNEEGEAEYTFDEYGDYWIRETAVPMNGKYKLDEEFSKENIMPIFVDNGVRFLGEMTADQLTPEEAKDGENLNTYLQNLFDAGEKFTGETVTGQNWLVFNDNGVEKLVAKKPLKHTISWSQLYKVGVVFGEGAETPDGYPPYKPQYVEINGKKYVVRLMRAYDDDRTVTSSGEYQTKGSEWNRLILPLIDPTGDYNDTGYSKGTNGRYGSETDNLVEKNMPTLSHYSWWTDFGGNSDSLGNYEKENYYGTWRFTQDTIYTGRQMIAIRGDSDSNKASASSLYGFPNDSFNTNGWLPVLEEVKTFKFYAAEGWVDDTGNKPESELTKDVTKVAQNIEDINNKIGKDKNNFSKGYDEFGNFYTEWKYGMDPEGPFKNSSNPKDQERTVKFFGEIKVKDLEVKDADGNDIPEDKTLNTYLQNLIPELNSDKEKLSVGEEAKYNVNFNQDTNWLVFKDTDKDGKEIEKLVSKKPLKHSVSWNSLYNAGVVFDGDTSRDLENQEKRNEIFKDSNYDGIKTDGNVNEYNPQYVEINGNKYIVRLMRAYKDSTPINYRNTNNFFKEYTKTKGSEWDRLILPLISDGRFGNSTDYYLERNMPTLASYSWWTNFGGDEKVGSKYVGAGRWMQENSFYAGNFRRASRGNYAYNVAATYSNGYDPYLDFSNMGWLPVLERVD